LRSTQQLIIDRRSSAERLGPVPLWPHAVQPHLTAVGDLNTRGSSFVRGSGSFYHPRNAQSASTRQWTGAKVAAGGLTQSVMTRDATCLHGRQWRRQKGLQRAQAPISFLKKINIKDSVK